MINRLLCCFCGGFLALLNRGFSFPKRLVQVNGPSGIRVALVKHPDAANIVSCDPDQASADLLLAFGGQLFARARVEPELQPAIIHRMCNGKYADVLCGGSR